jgi:hypothetical protein
MPDTTTAAYVIDRLVENTLTYSLLLAAIGTLSMAFIELVKGVTGLRRHFHRRQFNRWMQDPASRKETMILTTGGMRYENVLFEQPIERMLGQIQAAANLSLEFPDRYPHAYAFFAKEDLEVKKMQTAARHKPDSELWADFAERTARAGVTAKAGQRLEEESRAAQQARVRLGNLIARRLDAFQNRTQYLWARGNQLAAVTTAALLTAYVLTRNKDMTGPEDVIALVCVSLLAGMVAPIAKDVVSAISGIRTKA